MVLSLGFILAFIGAAVALLIGILIFSEVSDSIICPAGGTPGGGTVTFNIESYEDTVNQFLAVYEEAEVSSFFQVAGPSTPSGGGLLLEAVTQNGTSSAQTNGEILLATASQWNFLHQPNTGSNLTSINMWINGDTVGSAFYPILTNHAQIEGDGFQLGTDQGRLLLLLEQGGTVKFTLNISDFPLEPPDDGQWHMLSVSYDKGDSSEYLVCVDASCQGDTAGAGVAWTASVVAAVDPLTIGSDSDHATSGGVVENTFDVDDLGIWTGYELTQGDITTLYNSGAGVPANTIAPNNMIAYWSWNNSTAIGSLGETTTPGSSEQQGFQECENAKDTAWTVIGILPVALFFALFAIFGALGRTD